MAQFHDYIPKGDDPLFEFAQRVYNYSITHYTAWHTPDPLPYLQAPIGDFLAKKIIAQEANHGSVDIRNRNEAKKVLVAALRTYIQGFIAKNPLVSDEDRANMTVHIHDTEPTPHPTPVLEPETVVESAGRGRHAVTAIHPQTKGKGKPPLVKGVAFAYRVREPGAPPSRADDMPSVFQTGTTRYFQWGEESYGLVCDYATAYENEGGSRGPWSDVVSIIIQ